MGRRTLWVVCSGSRTWVDREYIQQRIQALPAAAKVLVGDARGADGAVRQACSTSGIPCERFDADWDQYGRRAGILRNLQMLEHDPAPELVLCFWIGASKGTRHVVTTAMKMGLPLELHWRPECTSS